MVGPWRLLALKIGKLIGPLTESIKDFMSMKELKRVSVPLRGGLLYFIYREYRQSGFRLFVAIRDIDGTAFQELKIESAVRLSAAVAAFLKGANTNGFVNHNDEIDHIHISLANGNALVLRRDLSEGKRPSLSIYLGGSSVSNFMEVPLASAPMVIEAVDGFLSLASTGRNKHLSPDRWRPSYWPISAENRSMADTDNKRTRSASHSLG